MNYDYFETNDCQYNELCGVFTSNPTLTALQEILLVYLQELAYYLLKLKELGAFNNEIKENIIDAISGIITNIDFNKNQYQKILMTLVNNLNQAKVLYDNLTKKLNINPIFLKSNLRTSNATTFNDCLMRGEKHFIYRSTKISSEHKNFFDLIILIIKRFCIKIIQLKSFKKDYTQAYESILELLQCMNFNDITTDKLKELVEKSMLQYLQLIDLLYNTQEEFYGKRDAVNIPFTPRFGKAILVSGIDMTQLETILKLTQDREIDVYTHGMTMLMAHTLPKFREYKNLVGHFGKGTENSLIDFATFPGSILMTKYLFQKVNYLHKGKLFTTDKFAPRGIAQITNNNYEPLIKAALESKGFTHKQQEIIQQVGFKQKTLEQKVQEVIEKFNSDEIKNIYFIGILHNHSHLQDYFKQLCKLIPDKSYVISLDYDSNEENILHIEAYYDYLLIYKFLEEFKKYKNLDELNITIFMAKCDSYTVTNIINFMNLGIKHIFMSKCLPSIISPSLANTIKKTFFIEEYSTPETDIEKTLN